MELERKPAKPKGVAALIEVENPNAKPKAVRMMKAKVRYIEITDSRSVFAASGVCS